MKRSSWTVTALLVSTMATVAGRASGDVIVLVTYVNNSTDFSTWPLGTTSIPLFPDNTWKSVNVYMTNTPIEDVPRITIETSGQFPLALRIQTTGAGYAGRNFGGVVINNSGFIGQLSVEGFIYGDLTGPITANSINFNCDGRVRSTITKRGAIGNITLRAGAVDADTIDLPVRPIEIRALGGSVTLVRVAGDCFGAIIADAGNIFGVEIAGGLGGDILAPQGLINDVLVGYTTGFSQPIRKATDQGTPNEPAANRVSIVARDGISRIKANRIYANITANLGGTTGALRRLATVAASSGVPDTGKFVGSLAAGSIPTGTTGGEPNGVYVTSDSLAPMAVLGEQNGAINVSGSSDQITIGDGIRAPITITGNAGDISALYLAEKIEVSGSLGNITIAGDIVRNSLFPNAEIRAAQLPAGKRIKVGRTFDGAITLGGSGSPGLSGQVIINSGFQGALTGAWNTVGVVKTQGIAGPGEATLSPIPSYIQTSASLGGGAVGLAPLRFYQTDSIPNSAANNALGVKAVLGNQQPIRAAYYGPLTAASTPMTIQFRQNASQAWTTLTSPPFSQTVSGRYVNISGIYTPTTLPIDITPFIGEYRAIPTAALKCAEVTGNPGVDGAVIHT